MSKLNPPIGSEDHSQGDVNASVTLVEYGDYQCPYCGEAYPIIKRIQNKMGPQLRLVFRNFPLTEMHPLAMGAAEMAEAAALQDKFWQMHDTLYENQDTLDPDNLVEHARRLGLDTVKLKADLAGKAVPTRVRSDFKSGVRSGVNGTPTLFINGVRFDGNWTDEGELLDVLKEAAV
jgi:protein-disulfide isomerase